VVESSVDGAPLARRRRLVAFAHGGQRRFQLAAIQKDALAALAEVDVNAAQHHLGQLAVARRAGHGAVRGQWRGPADVRQQGPQPGELLFGQARRPGDLAAVQP